MKVRGMLTEESNCGSFRRHCFRKKTNDNKGERNDEKRTDFTCHFSFKNEFYQIATRAFSPLEGSVDASAALLLQITLRESLFMDRRLVIGQILNRLSLLC